MFTTNSELKEYIQKIELKLNNVSNDLESIRSKLPTDAVKTAEKLKQLKDNCLSISSQANDIYNSILEKYKEFEEFYTTIKSGCDNFEEKINLLNEKNEKINNFYNEVDSKEQHFQENINSIKSALQEVEGYLNASKEFPEKLKEVQEILEKFKNDASSIEQIKSSVLKRKNEIDALHREILGHDEKHDDGQIEHIDGIKDDLLNSINGFEKKVLDLEEGYNTALNEYKDVYEKRLENNNNEFLKLKETTETYIEEIKNKINDLLPDAMAAGLSHAYARKREAEESDLKSSETKFFVSILLLLIASLMPVSISVWMLYATEKTVFDVIEYLPKLMSAFIPLYIPIFWVAYSNSKKIKLSKRIIEEYTHKEVLGKTFSGLSNQIEKLNANDGIQNELRMKLLYNFMQVTAENPGKLISDYNSADHPVMDALEKSAKLTDALEKIAKIPGFTPLAQKLAEKAEDMVEKKSKKVEAGFEVNEALNNKSDKQENS